MLKELCTLKEYWYYNQYIKKYTWFGRVLYSKMYIVKAINTMTHASKIKGIYKNEEDAITHKDYLIYKGETSMKHAEVRVIEKQFDTNPPQPKFEYRVVFEQTEEYSDWTTLDEVRDIIEGFVDENPGEGYKVQRKLMNGKQETSRLYGKLTEGERDITWKHV